MNINEIKTIVSNCKSKSDVCRQLGLHTNGSGMRKVDKLINEHQLDISHFDGGKSKRIKYRLIEKECPICGSFFKTQLGHRNEKTVCSHSCSNTYFRSGKDNPNYKNDDELTGIIKYVTICFRYHEKKCVYCGETNIVTVHHYDGNKNNNNPENLIPLCPTHHQYWHSRFRKIVKPKIDEYVKNFKLIQ